MDTITHGIAGALIGKAFFAPGYSAEHDVRTLGRTAILGATLGSLFPDSDSFLGLFVHNDLAIIQDHRYITHSFFCLPLFALLVAAVTRGFARWRGWRSPSWLALTAACAAGIASHILFDLVTSFGTMIWSPFWDIRAAWDLVFIIDFTFTGIVLVPQVAAWVYRASPQPLSSDLGRRAIAWLVFTLLAEGALLLPPLAGFHYSRVMAIAAPLAHAVIFFAPHWRGLGQRLGRGGWCRAGVAGLAAYLLLCGGAHALAVHRIQQFAAAHSLQVEALGAMPLPPTPNDWDALIRTPNGVYETRMPLLKGLRAAPPPDFRFFADDAPAKWIEAARRVPQARVYLGFARFPLYHFYSRDGQNVLEISDLRFFRRRGNAPSFTFQVVFDDSGRVLSQGWAPPVH
jgi:membrane-bound metal-dependent hydrolase YbcI (DUF457 family)